VSYLRDVVEEPRFAQDIDGYQAKYAHIDALHEWVTGTLSENPRAGRPFKEAPDIRVLTTPPIEDVPAFWVVYTFDENKVYLLSIRLVSDTE
jgi:hypothetical protein